MCPDIFIDPKAKESIGVLSPGQIIISHDVGLVEFKVSQVILFYVTVLFGFLEFL